MDEQWLREWSADECEYPPKRLREEVGELLDKQAAEIERLAVFLDAAHGLICNAHQKRVDDVTNEDGASPGWAEAARRWIDAYPFGRSV